MYIFGYLRASAHDQDASRAQQRLKAFALEHNHRVADGTLRTLLARPCNVLSLCAC